MAIALCVRLRNHWVCVKYTRSSKLTLTQERLFQMDNNRVQVTRQLKIESDQWREEYNITMFVFIIKQHMLMFVLLFKLSEQGKSLYMNAHYILHLCPLM